MPIYNKLARDSIPSIIGKNEKKYSIRTLNNEEYIIELKKKFGEELAEYNKAGSDQASLEELADLLELIHSATEIHGASFEELEGIRAAKAEKRGGFKKRIFLIEVEDDEA